MHWQAYNFVAAVKEVCDELFTCSKVVEFGACTVNYSIKDLFDSPISYYGVDLIEGRNVTVACNAKDIFLGSDFDIAISCECFEHNPSYLETFINMCTHVKPGGAVLFTCASTGRPEHGTSRTDPNESPGTSYFRWDYYKNLDENDFPLDLLESYFSFYKFYENKVSKDLYFLGFTKSDVDCDAITDSTFKRLSTSVANLSKLAGIIEKIWSEELDINALQSILINIKHQNIHSITSVTFSSYIVKLLALLDKEHEVVNLLECICKSNLSLDRTSLELHRQLYFIKRHQEKYYDAHIHAKSLFELEKTPRSLFILVESLSKCGFKTKIPNVVSNWIGLALKIENLEIREQLVALILDSPVKNSPRLDEDFITKYLSYSSNTIKKKAFKAKYFVQIGDFKKAKLLFESIKSEAKEKGMVWIESEYKSTLAKMKSS